MDVERWIHRFKLALWDSTERFQNMGSWTLRIGTVLGILLVLAIIRGG